MNIRSLPQVRLGTIGSEEELNTKIEEFARDRLKELLEAETKLRQEAEERCKLYETKLTENKGVDLKQNVFFYQQNSYQKGQFSVFVTRFQFETHSYLTQND